MEVPVGAVGYSVGEVSRYAGVTVRTLHHYDEIGLLPPSARTAAGYRRYTESDLERLQQVLYYRELGFPLEEISAIVAEPDADAISHLHRQHGMLKARIKRLEAMVTAIEYAMEAQVTGISLTPEERFEVFGSDDPGQYADEARERWGDSGAYRESHRRTSRYTRADWQQIKAEGEEINEGFAAALRAGEPATGGPAMDLAERHRMHIDRWFYPCPVEMHRCLGEMYVGDPRFTAHYDSVERGLAGYLRDAIVANAARAGGATS